MNFLLRNVEERDLYQLKQLADQFVLLNMPADEAVLKIKIKTSMESFSTKPPANAEYLFVVEDLESKKIIGSSLILAKHGTPEAPHNYIKVLKKEKFSQDLGIGFIHTILQFGQNMDGPTEIGGLLVDKQYRKRPERVGKQISLIRFLFMGLCPDRFQSRVLCELTPPYTKDGRSEFWEALGRRFTGLPYQEADRLSQTHKEFIKTLFPEENIYLTLLDAKARSVLGRVGESTRPAQHLLEKMGFTYINEVDPFDGGPHYGASLKDIAVVKYGKKYIVSSEDKSDFSLKGLLAYFDAGIFRGMQCSVSIEKNKIILPEYVRDRMGVEQGKEVFFYSYGDD